jgi:hypothetical protein
MPEIGPYSLSGGRRPALTRASSDPTDTIQLKKLAQFQKPLGVVASEEDESAQVEDCKNSCPWSTTPEPSVFHSSQGLEAKEIFCVTG